MGQLITVEGGEYVGKTSLVIPALEAVLKEAGVEVLVSREPGGTPEGEKMRYKIFQRLKEGAPTEELAQLFYQARRIHLDEVVIPFLGEEKEEGRVVLLDRYLDSSRIYQGYLGGLPLERIRDLDTQYVRGYFPNATFLLYFPEKKFRETFMIRERYIAQLTDTKGKRDQNAWDEEGIEKHHQRQKLYLTLPDLAKKWNEKREFFLIDASLRPIEVVRTVIKEIAPLILHDKSIKSRLSSPKQLMDIVDTLAHKGVWKDVEQAWEEQQKLKKEISS